MSDKYERYLRAHIDFVLENVARVSEDWTVYQHARQRLIQLINPGDAADTIPEEQQAILSDFEMCIAAVAYYLGFQDGHRCEAKLNDGGFIKQVLELLTPKQGQE